MKDFPVIKPSWLMLFGDVMTVCCKYHMKHNKDTL